MNTEEAIEKGYRLMLTGVDGQLVDLEEATIEDLRRAIVVVSSDRDRWKEMSWLGYRVINDNWEPTQFLQAYEEAIDGE